MLVTNHGRPAQGLLVVDVGDLGLLRETLDDLDCESPFELLGLFRGVGLAHASVTYESTGGAGELGAGTAAFRPLPMP